METSSSHYPITLNVELCCLMDYDSPRLLEQEEITINNIGEWGTIFTKVRRKFKRKAKELQSTCGNHIHRALAKFGGCGGQVWISD